MASPVLLFGATSITGYALARQYAGIVQPYVPPNSRGVWPSLHLEDPAWLTALFATNEPEVLIYCHAVCDVGKCEQTPTWAREINVHHVRRLLDALPTATRLVYVSSDHVFGGNGAYDEQAAVCPISVYGRTRVQAEGLVLTRDDSLVVRTGLAIGPSHNGRTGHADWLAYRCRHQLPITIIDDEFRSAVRAADLAERIMRLARSEETGLRHVAATRAVSRVQLAEFLGQQLGIELVFDTASRQQQPAPHLGHVELITGHKGQLDQPLRCILDCEDLYIASSDIRSIA